MQLTRKYPLCSSPTGSILHTQPFIIEDDNPLDPHISVVACDHYHFIFSDSRSIQKDYNDYYARISSYDNEDVGFGNALHTWDKDRLQEIVNYFFTDKDLNLNILDIGSSAGGLLRKLAVYLSLENGEIPLAPTTARSTNTIPVTNLVNRETAV